MILQKCACAITNNNNNEDQCAIKWLWIIDIMKKNVDIMNNKQIFLCHRNNIINICLRVYTQVHALTHIIIITLTHMCDLAVTHFLSYMHPISFPWVLICKRARILRQICYSCVICSRFAWNVRQTCVISNI